MPCPTLPPEPLSPSPAPPVSPQALTAHLPTQEKRPGALARPLPAASASRDAQSSQGAWSAQLGVSFSVVRSGLSQASWPLDHRVVQTGGAWTPLGPGCALHWPRGSGHPGLPTCRLLLGSEEAQSCRFVLTGHAGSVLQGAASPAQRPSFSSILLCKGERRVGVPGAPTVVPRGSAPPPTPTPHCLAESSPICPLWSLLDTGP